MNCPKCKSDKGWMGREVYSYSVHYNSDCSNIIGHSQDSTLQSAKLVYCIQCGKGIRISTIREAANETKQHKPDQEPS